MPPPIPRSTFRTLERENEFKNPSKTGANVPMLDQLVAPHIESFNALFEDAGSQGLLQTAVDDIGSRVVFDGLGQPGQASGQAGWGNKLECMLQILTTSTTLLTFYIVKILSVAVGRPMTSERQQLPKSSTDNRIYPAEVSGFSKLDGIGVLIFWTRHAKGCLHTEAKCLSKCHLS